VVHAEIVNAISGHFGLGHKSDRVTGRLVQVDVFNLPVTPVTPVTRVTPFDVVTTSIDGEQSIARHGRCSSSWGSTSPTSASCWLASGLRGPGVTKDHVLAATRGVGAALEIVDSRIADWRIKLADTIADNGSSARAVLGERVAPVAEVDLAAEPVRLFRNDEQVGTGSGADVLGHPPEAVAWLANRLAAFDAGLAAGQVVLPGAMCASVFAEVGETFRADFPHLGSVEVRFA
jgi:hypothetical protein